MKTLIRRVLGIKEPITCEAALLIAREYAVGRGWPWVEPVRTVEGITKVHVMTNSGARGGNVNVWIGVRDGRVVHAGFARR